MEKADGRAREPCKAMRLDGKEKGHDCRDLQYTTTSQMVVVGEREIDIGLGF